MRCNRGQCMRPQCINDEQCPQDQECQNGFCVPARQKSTAGPPCPLESVYFEFDKYDIKPEYRSLVEANARWLKANPKARLVIEGNADEQGSREYNLALGQRRAESVSKMMTLLGVRSEQVEAISYGEERPRSNGHDETAWSENRRADFAQR